MLFFFSQAQLCGGALSAHLRRRDHLQLRPPHQKTTISLTKPLRRHHDGPTLEIVHLTTLTRSRHTVWLPFRLIHRTNPSAKTTKKRSFVSLGNQRQIRLHREADGTVGISISWLHHMGQEDSQRKNSKRPRILSAARKRNLPHRGKRRPSQNEARRRQGRHLQR